MTVLVLILAANAIRALSRLEEGFTILVLPHGFYLWKDYLTVAVGKHALVSVAAETNFNPVFAQLSLIFGLKFGHHVLCMSRFGRLCCSIGIVDLLGRSLGWNKGCS